MKSNIVSKRQTGKGGKMNYHIALPPELGLSADEFAISWNETPDCNSKGEAGFLEFAETSSKLIKGEIATLEYVDDNADKESLYDLIRQAIYGQGIGANIEISELECLADGTCVLVVNVLDG
jgi:hypothetical protein